MSQGCSLLEQVSKNCHIYLCYVAMINSQYLRGHWGLQCCGVANFVCVCGISVNKSHRSLLRWSQTLKCAVFVFSNLHYPVWSEIYCGFWLTFRWEKKLALSFITAIAWGEGEQEWGKGRRKAMVRVKQMAVKQHTCYLPRIIHDILLTTEP